MSYTTEELTTRVKECLGKLITENVENYKEGKKRAAYATVDYNLNAGRILLVQWPNDAVINACWSPAEAGLGDLGTVIGGISTEYFGIETMVTLLTSIIQSFMEE